MVTVFFDGEQRSVDETAVKIQYEDLKATLTKNYGDNKRKWRKAVKVNIARAEDRVKMFLRTDGAQGWPVSSLAALLQMKKELEAQQ